MKPASMIFLVLAVILIFGGFMTCRVAKSMAETRGVKIYEQEFNDKGDAIYTYAIADDSVNKLNLTFSDIDVTVVGGAFSSYVELMNFDVTSYRTTLSGGNVTVDGTASLTSSMIDLSDGGIQFRGLRYFLLKKPDPESKRSAVIYLSDNSVLRSLTVTIKKGSVTFRNLPNSLDYTLVLQDADASFYSVSSTSVANINATNSDIFMDSSKFATVSANLKGGSFRMEGGSVITNGVASYDLSVSEEGTIHFNGGLAGETYRVTSPAPECLFKIDMLGGTIEINDGGVPAVTPIIPPKP